jgi:DNA-binding response OmpR family regulator
MIAMRDVLIIDGDADTRELIVEILTDEGYMVRAAPNMEAGLLAVEHAPPALLLLDILLPDMRGNAFLRILRAAGYTFPVGLITALPRDAESLMEIDNVVCIAKPFDIDELLECVARYVQPVRGGQR